MTDAANAEIRKIMRDFRNPKYSTNPPAVFVFDDTLTPMEQENQVLNYFFDNWVPKPKNIYKMAKRIYPQVPKFIQRSILDYIVKFQVDPVDYLRRCFDEKAEWAVVMERVLAEGNHGIIFTDHEVFGFSLKTNPRWLQDKEQKHWHPDDEYDIMQRSIEIWMEERNLTTFLGKIMLFPEYGFSGMPRKVHKTPDN